MNDANLNHRSVYVYAFNKLFLEFFDDIITVYPECKELRTAKMACERFRDLNGPNLIRMWYQSVYLPYRQEIEQGNVDFFLNKDYSGDVLSSSSSSSSNAIMDKIEYVRSIIMDMSPQNKEHAAKYILHLSKLADMYMAAKRHHGL